MVILPCQYVSSYTYSTAPVVPFQRCFTAPPPVPPRPRNGDDVQKGGTGAKSDLITLDPFAVTITAEEDPFGDFQKLFSSNIRTTYDTNKQFDEAIGRVDKRIADMRVSIGRCFVRGTLHFFTEEVYVAQKCSVQNWQYTNPRLVGRHLQMVVPMGFQHVSAPVLGGGWLQETSFVFGVLAPRSSCLCLACGVQYLRLRRSS